MKKSGYFMKITAALLTLAATAGLSWATWAAETNGQSRTFSEPRHLTDESQRAPSIGVHTGVAGTEGDYGNSMDWGAEVAFQPMIPISAGLELNGYASDGDRGHQGLTRTDLLAKGAYNFGGTIPVIRYSYVGAGIGPVWDNLSNTSHISLGLAPMVGFDIPIATTDQDRTRFTLGAAGSYLFVNNGMPDTLALNGVAKYWF